MPIENRTSDARYHQKRAAQERRLARLAASREAQDSHAELMRLHQLKRDGLPIPG